MPILNGTAFKNKGVQPLLDAVVDYLPAPLDLPAGQGMNLKGNEELERKPADDEPFAALAFKIVADPHVGKLTYFRVYSGTPREGRHGRSTRRTGQKERIGRILLRCTPTSREDLDVGLRPATSSPASASRTPAPATRCATPSARDRARGRSSSPSR